MKDVALRLLEYMSRRKEVVVVFSPRYSWQTTYLEGLEWANSPVVLHEAVPFISLLKAVDLVVSSGGTILREAAYLGVPAYSIFQGEIGGVDRYLESIGRLRTISSPAEFGEIRLAKAGRISLLRSNPDLLGELVDAITARVSDVREGPGGAPVRSARHVGKRWPNVS